jgi:hypothetical protein
LASCLPPIHGCRGSLAVFLGQRRRSHTTAAPCPNQRDHHSPPESARPCLTKTPMAMNLLLVLDLQELSPPRTLCAPFLGPRSPPVAAEVAAANGDEAPAAPLRIGRRRGVVLCSKSIPEKSRGRVEERERGAAAAHRSEQIQRRGVGQSRGGSGAGEADRGGWRRESAGGRRRWWEVKFGGRACRMDLPGPTTSVGTRTDYSVGPWDYPACAARHPLA